MEYTLQHVDVGLVLLDGDRRVVPVNAAVGRMPGHFRPVLGASLHDLRPPGSRGHIARLKKLRAL